MHTNTSDIQHDVNYSEYYIKQNLRVFPGEFVVRAFMGHYPNHHFDRTELKGKKVLDLGFGDGRNMHLFHACEMKIYGVEVSQSICNEIQSCMSKYGIDVDTRVGRNSDIPYEDGAFDYVLASSACYYMDQDKTYNDNIKEIARVLKPGGFFVHSLPMPTTFIMKNAKDLGDGHMQITQDPYGVRVGAVLKKFDNEDEIKKYLEPKFLNIRIGSCRDDYWGSPVHLWLVVCQRNNLM